VTNIKQFRTLIANTLKQTSGKGRTAEQVADTIVQKIEMAEDVLRDMGDVEIPILGQGRQEPPPAAILADRPEPSGLVDVSQRIGVEGDVEEGLMEKYTQEQLLDFAKNQMPSILFVKPPGFEKQFEINKFVEAAPGGIGFVRISYAEANAPISEGGQRLGPTVQISSTDKFLDADALTDSVTRQAYSMYTKERRVLTPKMPVLNGSPGDLSKALGAEAPDSAENVIAWNDRTSQPSASSQWKGLRRTE